MEDCVGTRFCCHSAFADSSEHIPIRKKMVELSSVLLLTASLYCFDVHVSELVVEAVLHISILFFC